MAFEIGIENDYPDHPKTLKLIALLGPQADVYPLRLWFWASKFRKDGVCTGGPLEVEEACKWKGASGKLHQCLVSVGLLEVDGITIHGWREGIGRQIAIYEAKKAKQRLEYAKRNGILPEERGKTETHSGNPVYSGNPLPNAAPPQGTASKIGFQPPTKNRPCPNCGGSAMTVAGPCPGCPEGRALRRVKP